MALLHQPAPQCIFRPVPFLYSHLLPKRESRSQEYVLLLQDVLAGLAGQRGPSLDWHGSEKSHSGAGLEPLVSSVAFRAPHRCFDDPEDR
jgi:hypothetical protein